MSIFDLEDGVFIFGSGDTGFDSDGHMMRRMSDNMALDLDTVLLTIGMVDILFLEWLIKPKKYVGLIRIRLTK